MTLCSTHITQLEKVRIALHNKQKLNEDRTTLILGPTNLERMRRAAIHIQAAIDILNQID